MEDYLNEWRNDVSQLWAERECGYKNLLTKECRNKKIIKIKTYADSYRKSSQKCSKGTKNRRIHTASGNGRPMPLPL